MPTEEMRAALADVRRAYRLVWSYQRRVLDIVDLIAGKFDEHEFYIWDTEPRDRPAGRGKDPRRDGRGTSFRYAMPASSSYRLTDRNRLQSGDRLLEVALNTDDEFKETQADDEPDAATFDDAAKTRSGLCFYGWLCTANYDGNWLNGVYSEIEWPKEDKRPVVHVEPPIKIVRQSFDLADLRTKLRSRGPSRSSRSLWARRSGSWLNRSPVGFATYRPEGATTCAARGSSTIPESRGLPAVADQLYRSTTITTYAFHTLPESAA